MNDITKALDSLHTLTDEEQAQVLQKLTDDQHHRTQFAHAFRSAMQGLTAGEREQVYEAMADYVIAGIEPNMEQMCNGAIMAWVLTMPYLAPATHTPYEDTPPHSTQDVPQTIKPR
jgi:hypothetical protein